MSKKNKQKQHGDAEQPITPSIPAKEVKTDKPDNADYHAGKDQDPSKV